MIKQLGEEHIRTGYPIVYTSADSVFQIAAHESVIPPPELYRICSAAYDIVCERVGMGRVIARPFLGEKVGAFARSANRRDLTTPPPEPTLLDLLKAEGREVISVGKIADIFGERGLTRKVKAPTNAALADATMKLVGDAPAGSLTFTNFVDFDTLFGHRRDLAGYAAALEAFDAWLPTFVAALRPGEDPPADWQLVDLDVTGDGYVDANDLAKARGE